jgi:DNA-binding transcriptional LysR family regulator
VASSDDLDWGDLRYFLHAVRNKSLAAAARALNVEHTTIGRRLTALEQALGATLVLRSREGLQLTPLGERVLPLVEELERTVRAVRELAVPAAARVRLAMPSGFTRFFAGSLTRLRAEHPGVELELLGGARRVDLEKGEADLAIRVGPLDDESLIAKKLGAMGWALYASEKYLARRPAPADPSDLSGHELIGYDASLTTLPAAQWIEERARTAKIVLRNREMVDMTAAAVSGIGLAVLPCWLAGAEPALKRLTPQVIATRAMSLVYRREAKLSEAVRAVIAFVTEVMNAHAAEIAGE